ncbi:MAG: ABC transporter permease [Thermoleophilia bacterium]|nr:ABC transporter permease [Thermoleophilia bacterium]
MRSTAPAAVHSGPRAGGLAYRARVLAVIAGSEFKQKYAGSALGYVWTLLKPLSLFAVLYVVFGRFFKLTVGIDHYPLYLLIGLVLWYFFSDGTWVAMPSIVSQASLVQKLAFPRLLIPASATVTVAMTFAVNLVALAAFVAGNRILPRAEWLALLPLFVELYIFMFAVSVLLATLFVRFRDTGQIWELASTLLFWTSPIIYPVEFLPPWAQPVVFLNPFVQAMQDVRAVIIGGDVTTVTDELGAFGHAVPLGVLALTLAFALLLFRREERSFAERI